jgi:hypothetical protein
MRIGDKVRMIHEKEEGVIVKFIDQKVVEVEVEEGFTIEQFTDENTMEEVRFMSIAEDGLMDVEKVEKTVEV